MKMIKKLVRWGFHVMLWPVDLVMYKRFVRGWPLDIKDTDETVDYILETKCSVSRFGDGELSVIWGGGNGFQKPNSVLAKRLKEVLSSPSSSSHIVCVPLAFHTVSLKTRSAANFWRNFVRKYAADVRRLTVLDRTYYDTNFTRFYIGYASKTGSRARIEKAKKIWHGRNVIVVEGKYTRLGVGNDLLDGAESVHRVLCPSKNAWDKYDEILTTVSRIAPKDSLILLALGMTATVLAYDLSKLGFQAIDIGHIDIEYEWFLKKVTEKCAIAGKAVNEVGALGNDSAFVAGDAYTKSIIATIE